PLLFFAFSTFIRPFLALFHVIYTQHIHAHTQNDTKLNRHHPPRHPHRPARPFSLSLLRHKICQAGRKETKRRTLSWQGRTAARRKHPTPSQNDAAPVALLRRLIP